MSSISPAPAASPVSEIGENIQQGRVNVGTSVIEIVPARAGRKAVIFFNSHSSQSVYLGNAATSASDHIQLKGAANWVTIKTSAAVWGRASGAGTWLTYLEIF